MTLTRSILIIVVSILIITGGVLLYFAEEFSDISLKEFEIEGIKDITPESFTIYGNLYIYNPSSFRIPLTTVKYNVLFIQNGQIISRGEFPSVELERNSVTKVMLVHKTDWSPSDDIVNQLVTEEHVYIELSGRIDISLLNIKLHEFPFSQRVDIKEFFKHL